MSKWKEIKCDFFNEKEGKYMVDAWKTDNDSEEGTVIAKLDLADSTVEYIDEDAKTDVYAQAVIKKMLENGYNDRQLVDTQELFSMDESDIALEVHKRFENSMEEQVDELDFYMELLEIGATVALVRRYEGDEKADHMQRFCEEHGLL